MAIQVLENLVSYLAQRTKINANFAELDTRLALREEEVGVSGYIRGASVTCTDADAYYPIVGAFVNKHIEGFTALPLENAIQYDSLQDLVMELNEQISTQCSKNGAVLTFAVALNPSDPVLPAEIIDGSDVSREFATGTSGAMGNITTVELTAGDKVQLVVKSSIAANVVSVLNVNTTIKRFF